MGLLSGKTSVITGGTRGLGLAIAKAFAAEGAFVVVASRSQKSVDEAVAQLKADGFQASGMSVDVGQLDQVEALANHAEKTFGGLDIWVNNAGISGPYGPTVDLTPEAFSQVVNTNIMGVYHGSRTALRHFMAQKSGKLINILGRGDQGPVVWQNAYASSKAWINAFTSTLALESKGTGASVIAYNPGMVLTELLMDVDVVAGNEDKLKVFPTIVSMWAKPPEVPAKKVVWLASSAMDGKTGLRVKEMSMGMMLIGTIKHFIFRIRPQLDMKIRSIPRAEK